MLLKKNKITLLIVCITLVLSSCTKRKYKVQIENRTKHTIDKLVLRLHSEDTISLAPYETSGILTLTYTNSLMNFFAEGGLSVIILKYDSLDCSDSRRIAPYWTKGDLKRQSLQKIIITDCKDTSNCYGCIFNVDKEEINQ